MNGYKSLASLILLIGCVLPAYAFYGASNGDLKWLKFKVKNGSVNTYDFKICNDRNREIAIDYTSTKVTKKKSVRENGRDCVYYGLAPRSSAIFTLISNMRYDTRNGQGFAAGIYVATDRGIFYIRSLQTHPKSGWVGSDKSCWGKKIDTATEEGGKDSKSKSFLGHPDPDTMAIYAVECYKKHIQNRASGVIEIISTSKISYTPR